MSIFSEEEVLKAMIYGLYDGFLKESFYDKKDFDDYLIGCRKNAIRKLIRDSKKGNCPECGGILIKRSGEHGEFIGCTNFPICKYSKSLYKKNPQSNISIGSYWGNDEDGEGPF